MSADLKHFLIGIGVTIAILVLLVTFVFGTMFVYQMGKNNTVSETVVAIEKVGVTAVIAKDAAIDAKNGVDQLKVTTEKNTTSLNELKGSVEKLATTKSEVKIVYIKPPVAPKQDPQDQSAMIKNAVNDGLADVKKSINDLGARMDRLDDGQAMIETTQKKHGERLEKVEKQVSEILTWKEQTARTLFGPKKEKGAGNEDCDDFSGNK